jgi:hypothetical protein
LTRSKKEGWGYGLKGSVQLEINHEVNLLFGKICKTQRQKQFYLAVKFF